MEQLSFKTKIGYDDIQKEFEYLMQKQRDSIKILCNGMFGIVSDNNPSNENSSLCPSISGNLLSFTSGKIVTKNGNFIELDSFSVNIPELNQDTVVLYTYYIKGSDEKRLSNNGKAYPVFYINENPTKCVRFLNIKDYNLLTSNVLNDSICLAIIKVVSNELVLDLTKNQYSFNRPWFSLCDISHRNFVGSGSSSVPHSIGLNDLTSSDLTIYEQLLTRGIIISKDTGIAGVPGVLYELEEAVPVEEFTDSNNTDSSNNNYLGIDLSDCYPNSLASVVTTEGKNVACHLNKGSSIVVIDDDTALGTMVNVQMCVTKTLIPELSTSQVNELKFREQDTNDIIITQGLEVKLQSTEVSFNDCSTFDKTFEIVVNKDGTIHKEPEILCPLQPLSNFSKYDINQSFDIPVMLYFERFDSSLGDKTIIVHGIDENGNEQDDPISIDLGSSTNMLFKSNYYFTRIDSIEGNLNDINTKFVVFAYAKRALDRRLRILNIKWNGKTQQFTDAKDIRPISTIIRDPFKVNVTKEAANNIINTLNVGDSSFSGNSPLNSLPYTPILIEDFNSPEYLDLNSVTWITSGKGINFPIIEDYVLDTSSYTMCYRSRKLNLYNNSNSVIFAYLVGADLETNNSNPVRLICENKEYVFNKVETTTGLYVVSNVTEHYGQILVTGTASGIAVFVKQGNN